MKHKALVAILMASCAATASDQSVTAYQRDVTEWRAQLEAKLKADDGWLTVVGLEWLKEGENRVGSNATLDVHLPKSTPDRVGVFTVKAGKARFVPAAGVAVTLNGKPWTVQFQQTDLQPDTSPSYDVLAIGRVKFFVIKREDKLGVRIKDNDSAPRKNFRGMNWYPVDPSWRVQAKYVPFDKSRPVTFDTALGLKEIDQSPGYVTFNRGGEQYRMEPVIDGKQLWFIMRDQTSGKTTYGASRFLYADMPKNGLAKAGTVELDFNKAENPPCVFSDYAICPLPPPQNRLALAVNAGEQIYAGRH